MTEKISVSSCRRHVVTFSHSGFRSHSQRTFHKRFAYTV